MLLTFKCYENDFYKMSGRFFSITLGFVVYINLQLVLIRSPNQHNLLKLV